MTEIRFIKPDELADYRYAIGFGFGDDPDDPDEALERFRAVSPLETCIVAIDRGRMVATFGSYDLDVTLPGGRVAMAGTTRVTVHPTHRRQGLLTEMMRMHLDQAMELDQPMAGLWASEERIYGRFGYGPAVFGHDVRIKPWTINSAQPSSDVSVHPLTADEARSVLPPLFERQLDAVAGRFARSADWWEYRHLKEPTSPQPGVSRQRYVMAERDGAPVGYLMFRLRQQGDWDEGRTDVVELLAVDDEARRALWHFATNIDLFREVRWWNAPVDDPLVVEADRFRDIERSVIDSVWLRPLNVEALLEARGYEGDGSLILGLHDRFGPAAGRYRLEVADGRAVCRRTDQEPDLELAVAELGRLLLGGASALTLHRAGLIDGPPAGVATLDRLFATGLQPHCSEVF